MLLNHINNKTLSSAWKYHSSLDLCTDTYTKTKMCDSNNIFVYLNYCNVMYDVTELPSRASTEKFPEVGPTEKRPKNSKIDRKNSTIKPLSTISVPCIKIQRGHSLPAPRLRRLWLPHNFKNRQAAITYFKQRKQLQ